MNEKPFQWMIDEISEEIAFWEEHGMDKESPDIYERMKRNLEKAKAKQASMTRSIQLVSESEQEIKIIAGSSEIVITSEGATLDGHPTYELHPAWYDVVPKNHVLHEKARLMAVAWMESQ